MSKLQLGSSENGYGRKDKKPKTSQGIVNTTNNSILNVVEHQEKLDSIIDILHTYRTEIKELYTSYVGNGLLESTELSEEFDLKIAKLQDKFQILLNDQLGNMFALTGKSPTIIDELLFKGKNIYRNHRKNNKEFPLNGEQQDQVDQLKKDPVYHLFFGSTGGRNISYEKEFLDDKKLAETVIRFLS